MHKFINLAPGKVEKAQEEDAQETDDLAWISQIPDSIWNTYQTKTGVKSSITKEKAIFTIAMGLDSDVEVASLQVKQEDTLL